MNYLDDLDWCNIIRALTFAGNFADHDNRELFLALKDRVMAHKTWLASRDITAREIKGAISE